MDSVSAPFATTPLHHPSEKSKAYNGTQTRDTGTNRLIRQHRRPLQDTGAAMAGLQIWPSLQTLPCDDDALSRSSISQSRPSLSQSARPSVDIRRPRGDSTSTMSTIQSHHEASRTPSATSQPASADSGHYKGMRSLRSIKSKTNMRAECEAIPEVPSLKDSPHGRGHKLHLGKLFGKSKSTASSSRSSVSPDRSRQIHTPDSLNGSQTSLTNPYDRNPMDSAKVNIRRPPKGIKNWFEALDDDSDDDFPEVVETPPEPPAQSSLLPIPHNKSKAPPNFSRISPVVDDYFRFNQKAQQEHEAAARGRSPAFDSRSHSTKQSLAMGDLNQQSMLDISSSDDDGAEDVEIPSPWTERSTGIRLAEPSRRPSATSRDIPTTTLNIMNRQSTMSMQTTMTSGSIPCMLSVRPGTADAPPLPFETPQQSFDFPPDSAVALTCLPGPASSKDGDSISSRGTASSFLKPEAYVSDVDPVSSNEPARMMVVTEEEMAILEMMRKKRAAAAMSKPSFTESFSSSVHNDDCPPPPPLNVTKYPTSRRPSAAEPAAVVLSHKPRQPSSADSLGSLSLEGLDGLSFPAPPSLASFPAPPTSGSNRKAKPKPLENIQSRGRSRVESFISVSTRNSSPAISELEAIPYTGPLPFRQPMSNSGRPQFERTISQFSESSQQQLPATSYNPNEEPYQIAVDLNFSSFDLMPLQQRDYTPSLTHSNSSATPGSVATPISRSNSGFAREVHQQQTSPLKEKMAGQVTISEYRPESVGDDVLGAWNALGGTVA